MNRIQILKREKSLREKSYLDRSICPVPTAWPVLSQTRGQGLMGLFSAGGWDRTSREQLSHSSASWPFALDGIERYFLSP